MNVQKMMVVGIVALLGIPAAAYANVYEASALNAEVIEGHTVYVSLTVNTTGNNNNNNNQCPPACNRSEQGTAVAILTREINCSGGGSGGPYDDEPAFDGVLWFNDQFLVGEEEDTYVPPGYVPPPAPTCQYRYPCGGSVYAVNSGVPDPITNAGAWRVPTTKYVHSYRIKDPNDKVWVIDAYSISGVIALGAVDFVWITSPQGGSTGHGGNPANYVNDTATGNCPAIIDNPPAGYDPIGSNGQVYSNVEYNAVLFMLWKNIFTGNPACLNNAVNNPNSAGFPCRTVGFGEGGANNGMDTDGQAQPDGSNTTANKTYSVGNGTGNSHPFNPYEADAGALHTHATGRVDIYFQTVAPPVVANRVFYIYDDEGSTQCFHEHPSIVSQPACTNGDPTAPYYSSPYYNPPAGPLYP
ncbi:MAG TPA: hypothetical protein VNZ52_05575 [Candidatus Thermoplasmatota archaeon]|nr:hypothetical protein [Candidatus Thermoplasmatota archaeon]